MRRIPFRLQPTAPRAQDAATRPGLLPQEILFGLALTGTSGAAVLAHTFGPMPMRFTVPFVVLPATSIVLCLLMLHRRLYDRLHIFSGRLLYGAGWGLAATLGYDAIRPLLKAIIGFSYNPYRAMPIFGNLITGPPSTDGYAIAAGWAYHFWNGISYGMIFALMRPRGGPLAGVAWGLALQGLMMVAYPTLLRVRLDDHGFLIAGIVGHAIWGLILAAGLKKWGPHA